MPDEDLAREVQELREALETLRKSFEIVSQMAQSYLRLLNLYAEYGGLSIDVVIPEIKHDPIAREIVKILFDLRRANVSQIARELKGGVERPRGTQSGQSLRSWRSWASLERCPPRTTEAGYIPSPAMWSGSG